MKKNKVLILSLLVAAAFFALIASPAAAIAALALAPLASLEPAAVEAHLKAAAEEQIAAITAKMNSITDPLIKRLEKAEGVMTPELKAQIEGVNAKFEAYQKQLDAFDLRIQKGNIPNQRLSNIEQIDDVISKAAWIGNFKETKKGGVLDLKGIDLHAKATIVRGADTIAPQMTALQYPPARIQHIRDLLPTGTTTASFVWMPYESAITNSIGRVAEGAQKLESDATFGTTKWAIEKIATHLKFSEEIFDDMPMFTSYLTTRWLELLKQAEDTKLLYGTGTNDIKGLFVSGTAYEDVLSDPKVDLYMILDAATTQVEEAGFIPDTILIRPADAMKLRQKRTTEGALIFPNGQPMEINGARIVKSTALVAGDFLVGDFAMGAQIWDRKIANIKFYDQDEDNAQLNLITAVIEERLALVTYQAGAFVHGDFASALASGSA